VPFQSAFVHRIAVNKFTGTKQYDCDDNNNAINPSMLETQGNNQDDDCDGTSDENPTYTIGWCNTQWPSNVDVNWGDSTGDIYGRVYVDGITNAGGDPNLIMAKIGIAPADFTSFSEFRYFPATYNSACSGCGGVNYEYMANVRLAIILSLVSMNMYIYLHSVLMAGQIGYMV